MACPVQHVSGLLILPVFQKGPEFSTRGLFFLGGILGSSAYRVLYVFTASLCLTKRAAAW
jgi:hypothetical protein